MARELLSPTEVRNLHYKTIIFPNIGYPIFRSTVIYTKLPCYSKGTIERLERPLINLKHTYYTAKDIPYIEEENNEIELKPRIH